MIYYGNMFAILPALFLTVLTLVVGAPVQKEQTLDFKASFESPEGSYDESTAPVIAGDEDLSQAMAFGDETVLEPQPISREQYEAALGVPAAQYTGGTPHATYQSLEVHWEEYDDFFPYIVLELSLPEIPGYNRLKEAGSFDRRAYLTVSRVLDKTGKNVYDAQHSFEEAPFNGIGLRPLDELPGYVQGERQIHVLKGVKEADLARIDGRVVLELPVNVRPLEFTRSELGQEKTFAGTKATLTTAEWLEYQFSYQGPAKRIIKWVGYDAEGKAIAPTSYTADIQDAIQEPVYLSVGFDRPVEKVKLFLAEDILTKTMPFTLQLDK